MKRICVEAARMPSWSAIPIPDDKQPDWICRPWLWRVANGFMAIFFALAAFVQVGDLSIFYLTQIPNRNCLLIFIHKFHVHISVHGISESMFM